MRIDVRGDNIGVAEHTRELIERRTRLAFGRVGAEASDIRIVLRDVNGPKKGIDRTCSVNVKLRRGGEVHAEGTAAAVLDAVDIALDGASRATLRLLARRALFRRDSIRFIPDVTF